MKYRVHVFAVVRTAVEVEAKSQEDAAEKAASNIDINSELAQCACEDAEEIAYVLVDEEGDEQYNNSTFYTYNSRAEKWIRMYDNGRPTTECRPGTDGLRRSLCRKGQAASGLSPRRDKGEFQLRVCLVDATEEPECQLGEDIPVAAYSSIGEADKALNLVCAGLPPQPAYTAELGAALCAAVRAAGSFEFEPVQRQMVHDRLSDGQLEILNMFLHWVREDVMERAFNVSTVRERYMEWVRS